METIVREWVKVGQTIRQKQKWVPKRNAASWLAPGFMFSYISYTDQIQLLMNSNTTVGWAPLHHLTTYLCHRHVWRPIWWRWFFSRGFLFQVSHVDSQDWSLRCPILGQSILRHTTSLSQSITDIHEACGRKYWNYASSFLATLLIFMISGSCG